MGAAWAVIVAAGRGERFGGPKQLAPLRGRSLFRWSLDVFLAHEEVEGVVLVAPPEALGLVPAAGGKLRAVVAGGARRQDSVANGFRAVPESASGVVLIHDGARPLLAPELISRVAAAARESGAAVPGVGLEDTVKEVAGRRVVRTADRGALVRVQTPQGFLYPVLKEALEAAARDRFYGTDEAVLVERTGRPVTVVPGDPRNIKVTTPLDLRIMEALLDD
ncbi:MAG: 2-C-methyl-D-erythritol 4-phosphate cytidylyltransferase [Candidatus Aminicenantes bacterium]|nr:2-C-methyl-D-erythritol 4-phosphate cytidylyltransferase [Candidatus Aminicenantes bacterium]